MSVKRIMLFLTPVIVASIIGCGKDHEAPTFAGYNTLVKPTNFVASLSRSDSTFHLSWVMSDTASVVNYKITLSDSSELEYGRVAELKTDSLSCSYSMHLTNALQRMRRTALGTKNDSLIVYFTVAAVYNNSTFNQFIGPTATVDSALYKK